LPNLRFSFSDAHMRLERGGWTRQVTSRELGISKQVAGVNMRLNAGGARELHWHKTPPELLQAHLKLSNETLAHLRKEKAPVIPA
jgi:hypothetical protein